MLFYLFSAQECNKSSTTGHKLVQRVFTFLTFAFIFLAPVTNNPHTVAQNERENTFDEKSASTDHTQHGVCGTHIFSI